MLTPDTPQVECNDDDECDPVDPPDTENPIGDPEDSKTVDPANGSVVTVGDELTYTLHFTNNGTGPVDIAREDDLSDVLDDATLISGPTSSDPALQVSGPDGDGRIQVTGTLDPDQVVTVTYTVQVKASGGNDLLSNFLVDPGEDPPPDCNDDAGRAVEMPNCTENPVSDIDAVKDVNLPHGSQVNAGDLMKYTLTFTNTGGGGGEVDYIDDVSDILDDAVWVIGPEAPTPSWTLSATATGS